MKKVERVFMSTPMKDRTDDQIFDRFEKMDSAIRAQFGEDVHVENNWWEDPTNERPSYMEDNRLWYLGRAIQRMGRCDAILFDIDWESARGCRIEHEVALEYGLTRYYLCEDGGIK